MPARAEQRGDRARHDRGVEAVLRRQPGQRREREALRQHEQRAEQAGERIGAQRVGADALAGLLGALLVLPQGFAFATLAGLPPEYGLYTAIVPCIVAALFGSSWHVVSGPTNANSLALVATLAPLALVGSPEYIALALAVTVLVGAMPSYRGSLSDEQMRALARYVAKASGGAR